MNTRVKEKNILLQYIFDALDDHHHLRRLQERDATNPPTKCLFHFFIPKAKGYHASI
jgi:hypothetical protein